jgi:hypothetical protein
LRKQLANYLAGCSRESKKGGELMKASRRFATESNAYCVIYKVPPELNFWLFYSQAFCDAKVLGSQFLGCRLYPFWLVPADNRYKPKFDPVSRYFLFAALKGPLPVSREIVVLDASLDETLNQLKAGASVELLRRRDVRLNSRKSALGEKTPAKRTAA